jgi:hypothetical protein
VIAGAMTAGDTWKWRKCRCFYGAGRLPNQGKPTSAGSTRP